MRPLKLGTRASKLALTQSNQVAENLRALLPGLEIELVHITTTGDRDTSDFLHKAQSVGFFTTEVENALLDRRADIAVHSLKDLPTVIREGLLVAAIPERESVADGLISRHDVSSLNDLAEGATVGTSSLRRIAQLKQHRPDLNCVPFRGNVDTRLSKVDSGVVDAAVMAVAGLTRLGLADRISAVLDPKEFLPAPAQGALGVQVRGDDAEVVELVSRLDDANARLGAETERTVLAALHGGCSIPLGLYTEIEDDCLIIHAVLSNPEGTESFRVSETAAVADAQQCAEALAQRLLNIGGREILGAIRHEDDPKTT